MNGLSVGLLILLIGLVMVIGLALLIRSEDESDDR